MNELVLNAWNAGRLALLGTVLALCASSVARAEIKEGVQFTGSQQTGQMAVDLAGSLEVTEALTGVIGIDNIPVQTAVIEVANGPVLTELTPATAATDCNQQPSLGATIETGSSGELVDVRNLVVELFSENSVNLAIEEFEVRVCLTESCGVVGEIKIQVNADADVDSALFCQTGSAVVTPTADPNLYDIAISGTAVVSGIWRAPLRVSGVPIPLSDDYDFDVPVTLTGKARLSARGLVLDLSALVNPSVHYEYDVAANLEDDPPLIVDADGYLVADAEAALGIAIHLQSFGDIIAPPDEGFPFEVTRFANVELLTQDRVGFDADFDAPIPNGDDDVVIVLDGQEIYRQQFRRFRKELFGDDVYRDTSVFGLDVILDFDNKQIRVRGTTRPKLEADLSDGLTVRLELGSDFGTDTVEINVFLGILWTLGECSLPGVVDGESCNRGDGVCESGFCKPVGLCADVSCDDGNECTRDLCDPGSGSCVSLVGQDGRPCDDGNGLCVQGTCEPLDACSQLSCNDGNQCTQDLCADGICSNPPVQDGAVCDGGSCQDGSCVDLCSAGCDDGEFCTFDLCEPTQGSCYNPPKVDRLPCDSDGHPGVCIDGACEQSAGCCEDGNECTDNVCLPGGACDNPPNDGIPCEGGAGICQGGACVPPTNPCEGDPCNDGNACTVDVCDPADGSCTYTPVVCEVDPNACIQTSECVDQGGVATCVDIAKPTNDSCLFGVHDGVCVGDCGPLATDPAACLCEPIGGCCEPTSECQRPVCTDLDPPNECGTPTNEPDGTICSSGVCQGGVCVDLCANVECDDFNECTDNVCDPATGGCSYPPVAEPAACTGEGGAAGQCIDGRCEVDDGFEVTSFGLIRLTARDWINLRADFDAARPENDDEVTISLDGQVIFSEKFRTFSPNRREEDSWRNNSLLGLDVTLDFANGRLIVRGTTRPRIDAELDDGLTVELSFSNGYSGKDTVEIDVTLFVLWSLAECSRPGAMNGDSCDRGRGVCASGFCISE